MGSSGKRIYERGATEMKIAVTSLIHGEGTTTVATSLAVMLAETGERVTYIDCNTDKSKGRVLLKPEIQTNEPLTVPGPNSRVSGKLIHGRAWGIDFHGFTLDGKKNCSKTEICRKLSKFAGNWPIVFDLPAGSIYTKDHCCCNPDIIVVVATPESLESERNISQLNRYLYTGQKLAILINKNKDRNSYKKSRMNRVDIAGNVLFDVRIEEADRNEMLALELIPEIRPLFGSIMRKVTQIAGSRQIPVSR